MFESAPDFPRNGKGLITFQRVTDILTNPLYTGHICSETYNINWLKGQHAPLISIDMFDKVQALRDGRPKLRFRKNIGDDFALRGFVACGDCGTLLRSSWSKGRHKSYAYYLCQAKGCASYGKSIARDTLEGEIGNLIKTLQPTENLFALTKAMFREAWTQRLAQAEEIVKSGKRQLIMLEKEVDALLSHLIETNNPAVIRAYEGKITDLERQKTLLLDQISHRSTPKSGTYEEKL